MQRHFKTLALFADSKNNNFDFMRLIAAILVIFSHSYPLTGKTYEPLAAFSNGLVTFGGIAVACFFVISGFLITRSYCQRHDLLNYMRARVLRIFPALIVAVLFAALLIGPMVTIFPLMTYFKAHELYLYIWRNSILQPMYVLPGVFLNNTYPAAVNGSLWTLPLEFSMYLIVAGFGIVKLLKKPFLSSVLVVVGFFILVVIDYSKGHLFITNPVLVDASAAPVGCFVLGMIAYLCRSKIILHPAIAVVFILLCVFIPRSLLFQIVFYSTFAYCILLFAYQQKIHFHGLTKHGDISYGVYIYAFIVQQTLEHYFHITKPWVLFLSALPITVFLAILSWHFIEKKALTFKKHLPQRT